MTKDTATFGRYILKEVVGEGAMARVYRAVRSGPMGFRKVVAIKVVHPAVAADDRIIRALINEARVGGFLRHRNLVEVYEFDQTDGRYYIAMELVDGHSLASVTERIPDQGFMPPRTVALIAKQICDGLAFAHDAVDDDWKPLKLVHRDLKPENITIMHSGVVKIIDWGIAKATINLFTTTGSGVTKGTPVYMSPEQIEGTRIDRRSDLFSVASIVVEMITGRPAFHGANLSEMVENVVEADATRALTGVEKRMPEMVPILERALQKNPEDRYPSAAIMSYEISSLYEPLPSEESLGRWVNAWVLAGAPI